MKKILLFMLSVLLAATMTSGALTAQAESGGNQMEQLGLVIENLKTDNLVNPLGIDSEKPQFSWNLCDPETRGQKQTSYRVTVAKTEEALAKGEYVWDSGMVVSDETTYISYDGAELLPSSRYFWCVEVGDKDGNTVKSETAWFETGLMDSGWSDAQWITNTDLIYDGFFHLTSFTIDVDFKIIKNTATFLFGASGVGDFYSWQISNNPNVGAGTYFRPHKRTNGSWDMYMNKVIAEDKNWGVNDFVHMTITVDNGVVSTYFDGELFDTHTRDAFELGYIGFRKPYDERMLFDNIVIKDGNGNIVYSEDFNDGTGEGFEGLTVTDGCADLTNDANNGIVMRYGNKISESAPMLRKDFSTASGKTVAKARLYITSAGIYRAYINGVNVTDSYLNPGMTAYDDHIMYQTYDVTDLINEGGNAIGAYLGHGWWNRALRFFGPRLHLYCKLLIEYTDGTADTVVTDDSWKFYRFGPILDDNIFNGFKFDGTVEQTLSGWNKHGFDESEWEEVKVSAPNAIVSNRQTPVIMAQNIPLIRNTITLDAIRMTEPKEGVYVYDFGQNVAGVVRITATAPKGTTIKLRHAEILNSENMTGSDDEPGMIFTTNLPRAEATDTYVFKGDPDGETFEPFFTYHGFRYLEITGVDKPLPLEDVKALLIMSDLPQTSTFESSHELVNRLYINSLWSARDNFMSVPTDCPQRGERFGWAGDAQIFTRTGSYMMDVNAFYQKYCMDIRDTSTKNRIIADVAPASCGDGWYGQGNRRGATNGFGDAIAIIPYQIYKQYGNKKILEENYETMCNWMDYLISTSSDYIRDESWTGDWMCVNETKSPVAVTDTAYCAYTAYLISETAEILGKPEDVAKYTEIYNNYRNAWRENFLEEDGCTTKCGTQTSYVLGIKFGLFNEDEIAGAAKNLVENIKSWDWHLTTGFLGYSFLNPILSDVGYTDVAYKLLEQTSYPSSLYSVTMGATTIWESWYVMRHLEDGTVKINDESQNHFSYGSVSEWLFRYMLGIERDDENSNSFKHFLLKPEFGGTFTYAKGSYDSIRGTIKSDWTLDKETGNFKYLASVPANTTATLYLPVLSEKTSVTESGIDAAVAEGVMFLGYDNGHKVYELESGTYEFETTVDPDMNSHHGLTQTNTEDAGTALGENGEELAEECSLLGEDTEAALYSTEEASSTEKKSKIVWDFEDNTMQSWYQENAQSCTVENGIVKLAYKTDVSDAHIVRSGIDAPAATYRYMVVKGRHNVPIGFTGIVPFQVYFRSTGNSWSEKRSRTADLHNASSEFRYFVLDMSENQYWTNQVTHLRIDPIETKSPSAGAYYFEFDEIMLAEEAKLVLNPGYDGGTSATYSIPAYVPVKLDDYKVPVRNGYKFLGWTNGETDDIITTFTPETDVELVAKWTVAPIVWDFDNGYKEGWSVKNGVDKGITDGVYKVAFSTSNADTWLQNTTVNFEAKNYKYLVTYIRHNVPEDKTGSTPFQSLFVRTTDSPWGAHLCVNTQQPSMSEEFVPYVVDMSVCSYWNGTVAGLRFDPFHIVSTADTEYYFEIDRILMSYDVKLTLDGSEYTVPAGIEIKLSDYAVPEKDGYVFAGWSESENGEIINEITIISDTALFAVWEDDATAVSLTNETVKAVSAGKETVLVLSGYDTDGRLKDTAMKNVSGRKELTFDEMGLKKAGINSVKAFILKDTASLSPECESKEHVLDTTVYAKMPAVYDTSYGKLVYFNDFKHAPVGSANLAVLDAGDASVVDGKHVVKGTKANSASQQSGQAVNGIEIISADGLGNRFKYKDGTLITGKMTVVYTAYNGGSAEYKMYNVADDSVFGFEMWLGYYMDWSGKKIATNTWSTWASKAVNVTPGLTRIASRAGTLDVNVLFHSVAVYVKEPGYVTLTDENGNNGTKMAVSAEKFVFPSLQGDKVVASWTDGAVTYMSGETVLTSAVEGKLFKVKTYADLSSLSGLNVVCIGDSLTEGAYGTIPANYANVRPANYPYFFGKFTGASVQNNGKSGYTPTMYYSSTLSTINLSTETDLVLIMLGTNTGMTDTLEEDTAYDSYADYADTQTGNYAKIIEYITEKTEGNAKIILMTPPVTTRRTSDHLNTTCSVIRQAAAKYGLDVIENQTSCGVTYDNLRTYMPLDELHFGYDGYKMLAAYVALKSAEYCAAE